MLAGNVGNHDTARLVLCIMVPLQPTQNGAHLRYKKHVHMLLQGVWVSQ
jgi:hypothetical protein